MPRKKMCQLREAFLIDAASNDAANMAADVEILEDEANIVADANESGEPETNEAR